MSAYCCFMLSKYNFSYLINVKNRLISLTKNINCCTFAEQIDLFQVTKRSKLLHNFEVIKTVSNSYVINLKYLRKKSMVYDQLKLQSQLCFRLYTVSRLVTQTYYPLLENLGITYPQYLVLMALWEEDNQKVMELAHRLYLDSNTMTPLVQRMAQLGLVERVKGEKDGRETYVSLTEHGKALQEKAKDIPSCMVGKLFENEDEFVQFKEIATDLDRLIARLSGQRSKEKEEALAKMREERLASKRNRK
mgnify:CR=1 FL=1